MILLVFQLERAPRTDGRRLVHLLTFLADEFRTRRYESSQRVAQQIEDLLFVVEGA